MNTSRPLSDLGLPAVLISRLQDLDFVFTDDVQHLQPAELSSVTGLSLKESAEVVKLASATSIDDPQDVLQMIEEENDVTHIVTFCEAIDNLLGEVCLSEQLLKSQAPQGLARHKCDMALHAVQHIHTISSDDSEVNTFTVESILKGIHYYRCHSYIEVLAVIRHLPTLLKSHPNIRLIVIDSVAFHFRHDFSNSVARTGLLCNMTHCLIQQARTHNLAVVVTNQMTTKIENTGSSQVVAALGETWGHCPTLRLSLHWAGHTRVATLMKAPHKKQSSVNFQVTVAGIRDTSSGKSPGVVLVTSEEQESKKRKRLGDDS